MIEIEQRPPGRAAGAGFYEYVDGRRTVLWPGLTDKFGPFRIVDDIQELTDRLLFAEALDTARCLESGLLRSTADANIGSLLGIGYPPVDRRHCTVRRGLPPRWSHQLCRPSPRVGSTARGSGSPLRPLSWHP